MWPQYLLIDWLSVIVALPEFMEFSKTKAIGAANTAANKINKNRTIVIANRKFRLTDSDPFLIL